MKYKQNYNKNCENYPQEDGLHAEITILKKKQKKKTLATTTMNQNRLCLESPSVSIAVVGLQQSQVPVLILCLDTNYYARFKVS